MIVKESVRATARERFEASVRAKVEGPRLDDRRDRLRRGRPRRRRGRAGGLRPRPPDRGRPDPDRRRRQHGPARRRASWRSPRSAGAIVRRGVPAHPGSMLWLARIGRTAILGLPTCGAYSKATAADLLLPRLLSGERRLGADRRQARPRRDPDPQPAVPVPGLRSRAGRARRLSARWRPRLRGAHRRASRPEATPGAESAGSGVPRPRRPLARCSAAGRVVPRPRRPLARRSPPGRSSRARLVAGKAAQSTMWQWPRCSVDWTEDATRRSASRARRARRSGSRGVAPASASEPRPRRSE